VVGTLNILLASREAKVTKLIYASSSSIYGDNVNLPKKETDPINLISPYALTKFAGEKYSQLFNKLYGLPTVCLRYFNVFGPHQDPKSQYSAAIPKFITTILNNQPPVIYGDGEQSRDFTYVDNVVRANILAATSKITGEIINIACRKRVTLNQIIVLINKILGKKIKPIYQPAKQGDIKHSLADITKAKKLLNYRPIVGLEEGLKKNYN
jgi:nucleoside-diphosphate-sugar epimerase